ncbi:hypothetical protein Ndes2526A_g05391 [Nannochloris sp. 'desiccata']
MDVLLIKLSSALGAKEQFQSIGKALDQAELENPDLFETPEWPHAAHIIAHIYSNNLEDARFVYKRTPETIITSNSDIQAAFSLLQRLWVKDYEGIWGALAYSWPAPLQSLVAALRTQLQERTLLLVQRAYSNVSISNLSRLLGISEQETASVVAQRGWEVQENGLLLPASPATGSAFEPSETDLQKIAQYVVFLQAGEALPTSAATT